MLTYNNIKYLVVHCTDSNRDTTTYDQVDFWHKQKDFKSEKSGKHIGYHYFLDGKGKIFEGRKIYKDGIEKGSHALGLNSSSIGICLALKKDQNISKEQRSNLKTLLKKLCKQFGLSYGEIIGHRDVWRIVGDRRLATECPTDSLWNELQVIKVEIKNDK